jgi:hypothetical protein
MDDVVRMPRWRVDIIRKRAEHLGTIEAANEKEANREGGQRVRNPAREAESNRSRKSL